jgi:multicomponent Na+:H+ antiporter subunit B
MKNIFTLFILLAFGFMIYSLVNSFKGIDQLPELGNYYAQPENITKVNSANLVTAVVISYRGLDTLGEVTILFLTAAIIAFFLKKQAGRRELRKNSEILTTAAKVLFPLMIMLGVYIFINGHLTPGGGFQGGSVIASAVILMLLTFPEAPVNQKLLSYMESVSGFVYVGLAVLGALLGLGFLDNAILPLGTFGKLLSAGTIPVIYSFVGLKVGAELSNILVEFKSVQADEN